MIGKELRISTINSEQNIYFRSDFHSILTFSSLKSTSFKCFTGTVTIWVIIIKETSFSRSDILANCIYQVFRFVSTKKPKSELKISPKNKMYFRHDWRYFMNYDIIIQEQKRTVGRPSRWLSGTTSGRPTVTPRGLLSTLINLVPKQSYTLAMLFLFHALN